MRFLFYVGIDSSDVKEGEVVEETKTKSFKKLKVFRDDGTYYFKWYASERIKELEKLEPKK